MLVTPRVVIVSIKSQEEFPKCKKNLRGLPNLNQNLENLINCSHYGSDSLPVYSKTIHYILFAVLQVIDTYHVINVKGCSTENLDVLLIWSFPGMPALIYRSIS